MKLTILLMIVAVLQVGATTFAQRITLTEKNAPLEKVLDQISIQTGFDFLFTSTILKGSKPVNINVKNADLNEVLRTIFEGQPLEFSVADKSVVVSRKETLPVEKIQPVPIPQPITIDGQVTNAKGEPLVGVTVLIKGTGKGVITDANGYYKLQVNLNDKTLIFSCVGMIWQEVAINGRTVINVVLVEGISQLNEISIFSNGYQSLPKERVTGSFSTITSKELEKIPLPNVLQRLEGQVPGVKINVYDGDRSFDYSNTQIAINSGTRTVGTNDYNMTIRGTSTFQGEKFPLVVVDGTIRELDISTLNPDDIESITFLKDAAAASIWGSRAANGVIVITSKKGKENQAPLVNFSTNITLSEKPDLGYVKMMTSAQMINYEKELVARGFITDPGVPTNYSSAQSAVRTAGVIYALRLKANPNDIVAQNKLDSLSGIDNRSQISKYLLQPASSQQYNLAVSGGSNYSTYYYSASYSKEIPNIVGNKGERLTLEFNNSWKLFKIATLSTNVSGSFFKYTNDGISFTSLFQSSATTFMPYDLLKDANGNNISYDRLNPTWISNNLTSAYKDWRYNYLDEQANADNTQKDNNYTATIKLNVPLFKGLSFTGLYSTEKTFSKTQIFSNQNTYVFRNMVNYYTYPTAKTNSLGITTGGILQLTNTSVNNYSMRGQLEYARTFKSIHSINAIAGTEIRQTQVGQGLYSLYGYDMNTGFTNSNINFSSTPTYAYISGDGTTQTTSTTFNQGGYPSQADKTRRYLSYFGNVGYSLMNRYMFSASVRYDDYNNFGLDRKYRATPMWSTGLKWNMKEESFLKQYSWINNLAIRATYGINGNISTTIYPFTNISLQSSDPTTGQPYSMINAFANPQLRWEKTYVTNFGLDYGFLNNRISGSFEVYYKNGNDILYSYPINQTYSGNITSSITENAASIKGNGFDANINGIILSTKNLNWNTGITLSYNTNKVNCYNNFGSSSYSSPSSLYMVNGYATDAIFVYRNVGLDANGMTQISDGKGGIIAATTATITTMDPLKYAGRTTAPYFGGWNTSLQYKQFSLYVLATYQFGGVFMNRGISTYITSTNRILYDLGADIAKRWEKAGDELTTNVPGLNSTSATVISTSLSRYQYSDINILSSDYIRLREISLRYQIPAEQLKRLFIKGASVAVTVRNLGLLWKANNQGFDPDFISSVSTIYSLPAARSYNLSLNINF